MLIPKSERCEITLSFALVVLNKNDGASIAHVMKDVPRELFQKIIAVDGHSSDNSVQIFNELNVQVDIQPDKGRGRALIYAVEKYGHEFDNLVFFSTDGNENPKDLRVIVELLQSYDLVIGSRMMEGAWNEEDQKLLKVRKWANQIFAALAWCLFSRNKTFFISDPLNGLRGAKSHTLDVMNLQNKDFGIEYEISIKAYKHHLKVKEFPTIEMPRLYGKSGVPPAKTVLQLLVMLLRESFR